MSRINLKKLQLYSFIADIEHLNKTIHNNEEIVFLNNGDIDKDNI